jgi:5-methylcytosine-specific restriction endonuclease McrA
MKRCCSCELEKSLEQFNKDKNKKDGRSYRCKDCNAKSAKLWREKNPEKFKESLRSGYLKNREKRLDAARSWRNENKETKREYNRKRKSLLRNGSAESFTDAQVISEYGNLCHICSTEIDMNAPRWTAQEGWEFGLHIDHVVPVSKGGPHSIDNVRPSHAICNLRKNDVVL